MGWKKGPLPPGTRGFGGVVLKGWESGWAFAGFCGDHVIIFDPYESMSADEVAAWNNDLPEPPPEMYEKRTAR